MEFMLIKAVCFWGHGASYGLAPWKKWKRPPASNK